MKPLVNLASEPFRNRRLFWLAILLLFAIPSYLGLRAIESMTLIEREIVERNIRVGKLESDLKKITRPASGTVKISRDQNRQLVAAGELIARWGFSWSQLLNDIERNLPSTVRVLKVAVTRMQPADDGELSGSGAATAALAMDVIGKSGKDVTDMINRFQETGRFKVQPVAKKSVEGTNEVEFSLYVEYIPPAPVDKTGSANIAAADKTAENKQ